MIDKPANKFRGTSILRLGVFAPETFPGVNNEPKSGQKFPANVSQNDTHATNAAVKSTTYTAARVLLPIALQIAPRRPYTEESMKVIVNPAFTDIPQNADDARLVDVLLSGSRRRRLAVAERLLETFGDLRELFRLDHDTLRGFDLGEAEVTRLLACREIARRLSLPPKLADAVHSPDDAYRCVAPHLHGHERERFVVAALDVRNRPKRIYCASEGSVDSCPVDPREVFAQALTAKASAVILAHNHPSGDSRPSQQDISLTQRLVEAGEALGLPVLDHIVVGSPYGAGDSGDEAYTSLACLGIVRSRANGS